MERDTHHQSCASRIHSSPTSGRSIRAAPPLCVLRPQKMMRIHEKRLEDVAEFLRMERKKRKGKMRRRKNAVAQRTEYFRQAIRHTSSIIYYTVSHDQDNTPVRAKINVCDNKETISVANLCCNLKMHKFIRCLFNFCCHIFLEYWLHRECNVTQPWNRAWYFFSSQFPARTDRIARRGLRSGNAPSRFDTQRYCENYKLVWITRALVSIISLLTEEDLLQS